MCSPSHYAGYKFGYARLILVIETREKERERERERERRVQFLDSDGKGKGKKMSFSCFRHDPGLGRVGGLNGDGAQKTTKNVCRVCGGPSYIQRVTMQCMQIIIFFIRINPRLFPQQHIILCIARTFSTLLQHAIVS
jgi:hypothetical protein